MDSSQNGSKGKLIAWCVLIAAVVIVYVAVTAHTSKNSATAATTPATTSTPSDSSSSTSSGSPSAGSASSSSTGSYKDGSYSSTASYSVPHGSGESIDVSLSVSGGVVKSVSIQQSADNGESAEYQAAFRDSYETYVVGKKLSDIQLSRVSGASLTSEGFNQALDQIRSQAQS